MKSARIAFLAATAALAAVASGRAQPADETPAPAAPESAPLAGDAATKLRDAQAALSRQSAELASARGAALKARMALASVEKELADARAERERLVAELAAAKGADGATTAPGVVAQPAAEASAALAAARSELQARDNELANARAQLGALDRLREDLAGARRQVVAAVAERDAAQTRLRTLEAELENLKRSQSSEQANRTTAEELAKAWQQLASAEKAMTPVQAELAEARLRRSALEKQLADARGEVAALKQERDALRTDAETVAAQTEANSQLEQATAELARSREAHAALAAQRDQLIARVAELEASVAAADEAPGKQGPGLEAADAPRSGALHAKDTSNHQIGAKRNEPRSALAAPAHHSEPGAAAFQGVKQQEIPSTAAATAWPPEPEFVPRSQTLSPGAVPGLRAHPRRPSSRPETVPVPAQPAPPARERSHVIQPGDTLTGLSLRFYGTPHRWADILERNRDVLPDEHTLYVGRVLHIPETPVTR